MVLQIKKGLIPPHHLTNFEIKEYYENELRFNGVYFKDNLPQTIKNGAYVISFYEYADVATHWIALYVKNNEVIHFDSFGVEHAPKEIKRFIGHKNKFNGHKNTETYIQNTSRQFSNEGMLF